jgi:hypothetical protein
VLIQFGYCTRYSFKSSYTVKKRLAIFPTGKPITFFYSLLTQRFLAISSSGWQSLTNCQQRRENSHSRRDDKNELSCTGYYSATGSFEQFPRAGVFTRVFTGSFHFDKKHILGLNCSLRHWEAFPY